jgi:hypothetical protein
MKRMIPILAVQLLIPAEAMIVHSPSRRPGGEFSCTNIGGYPSDRGNN